MKWYVLYTKPNEELRAQENLQQQGFETFLPMHRIESLIHKKVVVTLEPLFWRYLFIRLDQLKSNWAPIRSTRGVSKFLRFGTESDPVVASDLLIEMLKDRGDQQVIKHMFEPQELVQIQEGPFRGLEAFYVHITKTYSGESRALLLIEMLGKQQKISLPLGSLKAKH